MREELRVDVVSSGHSEIKYRGPATSDDPLNAQYVKVAQKNTTIAVIISSRGHESTELLPLESEPSQLRSNQVQFALEPLPPGFLNY